MSKTLGKGRVGRWAGVAFVSVILASFGFPNATRSAPAPGVLASGSGKSAVDVSTPASNGSEPLATRGSQTATTDSQPVTRSGTTDSGLTAITVSAYYTEPADEVDGFGCKGLAANRPHCSWTVIGVATFTGTFWGVSPFDCSSELPSFTPDGKLTYTCSDYVTGGVQGCGTGSFIVDDYKGYIDFSKYDPATNSAPGFNTWKIRPHSATGTLADHIVSGQGVNHWRYYENGELGLQHDAGRGHFTGTITCRA